MVIMRVYYLVYFYVVRQLYFRSKKNIGNESRSGISKALQEWKMTIKKDRSHTTVVSNKIINIKIKNHTLVFSLRLFLRIKSS
jgi:hypothetical protein